MDVEVRATYRIETFGGLRIAGGTTPLTGAATQRKPLLLLAVLATAGEQGVGRERLVGLFWPESEEERARHALKQAVHAIRRDLRDPEVIVGVQALRLNAEVITSDVAEFEEALAAGALERAAAVYRGPFLDGLWLDGAPEFERWLERERARLAHAYAGAVEKLATTAAAAGDHAAAARWWRALAAADPLSARVALALMQALSAAGEPEAALQHARAHEAVVRQELDTTADANVMALAARIRARMRAGDYPRQAAVDETPMPPPVTPLPAAVPPVATPVPTPVPAPVPAPAGRRARWPWVAATALLVLAVGIGTLRLRRARTPADAPGAERTVAVLPFVDMSPDGANAYVADGISEEIITALSHVRGLRVTARTSSFALRGATLDVRAIGDTLGVGAVVEGSVRRQGDRLRVTAQLIDARTGYHLWAADYDREPRDLIGVQDEIAGAIARALELTLVAGVAPTDRTTSEEAHDLYLRGSYFRDRLTSDGISKAIVYYDSAIRLDSTYALAWAGKATALMPQLFFRRGDQARTLAEARDATRRALALDPDLGEAHVALGIIHLFNDWDLAASERDFRRALALAPNDPHALHHWANWLRVAGRVDQAIAVRRRILQVDPLNARTSNSMGHEFVILGQVDSAFTSYRRAVDIDSMNPNTLGLGPALPNSYGELYEAEGRYAQAVDEYLRVAARRRATPGELASLRAGFERGGMRGFWQAWWRYEAHNAAGIPPRALRFAGMAARTGDAATAAEWLERAYAEHDVGLIFLGQSADFRFVRDEPRIVALLARMHLPRRPAEPDRRPRG